MREEEGEFVDAAESDGKKCHCQHKARTAEDMFRNSGEANSLVEALRRSVVGRYVLRRAGAASETRRRIKSARLVCFPVVLFDDDDDDDDVISKCRGCSAILVKPSDGENRRFNKRRRESCC